MEPVKVVKIERKKDEFGYKLVAWNALGDDMVFGHTPTEIGSKRMLAKRAKQFGLTVNGDIAT
jgi:hypothetical protein